ncbi:hypothetical protein RND71_029200 [Anisodus tanguticus]|uniref:Uncharacterized protein n=1 Tax=Anisodus tanguticus TaxID=243964 RepID=A0AAE1RFI1_9SOLA|nr:hypothetical protein RND71_029200 [Anisodus tanguticus]
MAITLVNHFMTGNSIRPPIINAIEIFKVVNQIITSQTPDLDGKHLKGNSFSGPIPAELLAKAKDGSLLLSYDKNDVGSNCHTEKKKIKKLSAPALASIVASVVVFGLLALLLLWIFRKKNKQVGYCVDGTNIGIIYEYMPNGSLDKHLSGRPSASVTNSAEPVPTNMYTSNYQNGKITIQSNLQPCATR